MKGGIDEAGRGPAIGPMVISLVIPNSKKFYQLPLKDSKDLSPTEREDLFPQILEYAHVFWAFASPQEIDRYNLNQLEFSLMEQLLSSAPYLKELYIDRVGNSPLPLPFFWKVERVVYEPKADRKYPEVAAASIVAKVVRDKSIEIISAKYRDYGEVGSGYLSDAKSRRFVFNFPHLEIVRKKWLD